MKGYSALPIALALLKPYHQIVHWGSLVPLQRCCRCILQSQPSGSDLESMKSIKIFVEFGKLALEEKKQQSYINEIACCFG